MVVGAAGSAKCDVDCRAEAAPRAQQAQPPSPQRRFLVGAFFPSGECQCCRSVAYTFLILPALVAMDRTVHLLGRKASANGLVVLVEQE